MLKILIVEDEKAISNLIAINLTALGYRCFCAYDGKEAADMIEAGAFDLVLLDIMLPEIDGYELLEFIKYRGTPVIFVTAKGTLEDKIKGLRLGADDYLTKPFVTGELLARVRALTRRKGEIVDEHRLDYNGLELNKNTCSVMWQGNDVKLSLKEYQIMELLISNPKQIISKERIIEKIWGYESDVEYNNIEVYISFLRKKLLVISAPVQIKTARGIGYSLI